MRLKDTSISAVVVLAALFSPGGLAPVAAQSLADVARQEQERRKAIKATSKVLTNKDLGAVPTFTPPATTTPAADGTPAAGKDATKADPAAADGSKTDTAKPPADGAKDQAYWSGRWKDLQTQLARNETFAIAMQSRINALANEYTNQGDGVKQAAIAVDRQRAVDELNRLKKETEDLKLAVTTLQEEARLARVPPGWLR
jgi:hypothetical protein